MQWPAIWMTHSQLKCPSHYPGQSTGGTFHLGHSTVQCYLSSMRCVEESKCLTCQPGNLPTVHYQRLIYLISIKLKFRMCSFLWCIQIFCVTDPFSFQRTKVKKAQLFKNKTYKLIMIWVLRIFFPVVKRANQNAMTRSVFSKMNSCFSPKINTNKIHPIIISNIC